MSYEFNVKQVDAPNLKVCKMNCDDRLHEDLEKYEITKILNKTNGTIGIIGLPGQGKSNLLWQLFSKSKDGTKIYRKRFNDIFYFSPESSAASMGENNIFSKLPPEKRFNELNVENLQYINDYIHEQQEEDLNNRTAIILDDMGAYLKNKSVQQLLKKFIMNRRHLRLTLFIVAQTWYSIDKEIRRMLQNVFLFKTTDETLQDIARELFPSKKEVILDVGEYVFNEPYKFLFFDVPTSRFFNSWKEELIFTKSKK